MAWKQNGRTVLQEEPHVLSEDYLPRNLLGREVQVASLRSSLLPVLKLIEGSKGILSKNLWDLYEKECGAKDFEPVAKRTYSYYLNRMVHLKLIEAKRAKARGHVYEFSVREE